MNIAIIGPESSGKSYLCTQLQAHYKGTIIPDYSRYYLATKGLKYNSSDILSMANAHLNLFLRNKSDSLVIWDTDILNYYIWYELKFGVKLDELKELSNRIKPDISFLLFPSIKWEYDPMRESQFSQDIIYTKYIQYLKLKKSVYYTFDSIGKERLQKIRFIIDYYLTLQHR
ncbi:MAG: AAA family ATPase [Saprospiraceae bacterium]